MSAISRRGLITLFRGRPEPSFSLDAFYQSRAAHGGSTSTAIPRFTVRDDGIATETSSVGVTRPIDGVEGVVRIRQEDCLAHRSFCSVCSERCPVPGAIVIELGRPRVEPSHCNGCGICVGVCPAPVNAFELIAREHGE